MPSDDFSTFIQLSALVTGFAPSQLHNSLQSNQPGPLYWQYAQTRLDMSIVSDLLELYSTALANLEPPTIEKGNLNNSTVEQRRRLLRHFMHGVQGFDNPQYPQTLATIVKAWYLGSWYQPYTHGSFVADTGGEVVSQDTYRKALCWQAMQSHAMGDSAFTFGYWKKNPAALLTDYTGYTNE